MRVQRLLAYGAFAAAYLFVMGLAVLAGTSVLDAGARGSQLTQTP